MTRIVAGLAALALATTATAQTPTQTTTPQPAPTTQSRLGALGGLLGGVGGLGGGLPNLGGAGLGNVTGLLGYCVRNKLTSGAGVASVLGKLTGKPGVTTSDAYAAGQNGVLQSGTGKALSLDGVKANLRTKVCDLVLSRAKSFL